ncbi:MAG: hypothetical protein KDA28_05595, partial [Phycisphaerales bacterium]|nr:hypothetical protein [Phycisphaerales bacterium]
MMIPSIDLMGGHAVQLVGGRDLEIDAGDPRPIARRFGRLGEVAVIDLDAALGKGSNREVIRDLLALAPCRVGGGIRGERAAIEWLDAGARRVIIGTAATPDLLRRLPRDRVIVALDARDGRVVDQGWTHDTGDTVESRIEALAPFAGGFLLTMVEREGRMTGLDMERVSALVKAAGDVPVTVAGGVRSSEDIALADRAGADVQVGMALYRGVFDLAEGFCAPLRSDRADGLWPTIVCTEHGQVLGLVYSSLESVRAALESGKGVYYSRSRRSLWEKGATSGDTQDVVRFDVDCDRDALRVVVRQAGRGFCHTGTKTCFGDLSGIEALEATVRGRLEDAPEGSYTARLLRDPELLRAKLHEEV